MATALTGFIEDLRNGVSAGEAFNNMLNRIVDSLVQMSVQSLFSSKGGLGSIFSSMLGVPASVGHRGGVVGSIPNDGRSFAPALWSGATRYHSGGIVGLLDLARFRSSRKRAR